MKRITSKPKYYCIDGEHDVAFCSEEAAIKYDVQVNPQYHATKDSSLERTVRHIYAISWSDLTLKQKDYLVDME